MAEADSTRHSILEGPYPIQGNSDVRLIPTSCTLLTRDQTYFSAAWSRTGRKGPYAHYYVQIQPNGGSFVGKCDFLCIPADDTTGRDWAVVEPNSSCRRISHCVSSWPLQGNLRPCMLGAYIPFNRRRVFKRGQGRCSNLSRVIKACTWR